MRAKMKIVVGYTQKNSKKFDDKFNFCETAAAKPIASYHYLNRVISLDIRMIQMINTILARPWLY